MQGMRRTGEPLHVAVGYGQWLQPGFSTEMEVSNCEFEGERQKSLHPFGSMQ